MDNINTSDFQMTVADVFQITGRGTAVTGRVKKGVVSIGDILCLYDSSMNVVSDSIKVKDLNVGFSRTKFTSADEGMNVALMLGEVDIIIREGFVLRGV